MNDWRPFFPLDREPREGQIRAIESILEAFESGIDTCIIDAPTGCGKSAIAVTVARYLTANEPIPPDGFTTGAYVLTTQKILQEQYLRDFADESRGGMLELKSATNYACGFNNKQSCGESKRALTALGKMMDGSRWKSHCTRNCVYNDAKRAFLQGLLGITNYSFFLSETHYVGKLEPRQLLILDECHTSEDQLTNFVEVEITERFCKKHLGIPLCSHDDVEKLREWLLKKYKPALAKILKQTQRSLLSFKESDTDVEDFKTLVKHNDLLDKHMCKINRFLETFSADAWVVNRERRKDQRGQRHSLQFKPIDAVTWAEPYLLRYGRRRLLMSATVLDKRAFCRSLGLDEEKTAYLQLPSTFPLENRPIHYCPVGKMSYREIDKTLPKLVEAVRALLEAHKEEKGIIHTVSFKISNYLRDALNDPRLLVHGDSDRDAVLERHRTSLEPTVLMSPSMMEGISLDDDLARFQIVAKLPYPHLGDKALKKRIERDPGYYQYLAIRSFVQMIGRTVRHEDDRCVTYVTDGCLTQFLRQNADSIPDYVRMAIV